jgi:hypothetical protein
MVSETLARKKILPPALVGIPVCGIKRGEGSGRVTYENALTSSFTAKAVKTRFLSGIHHFHQMDQCQPTIGLNSPCSGFSIAPVKTTQRINFNSDLIRTLTRLGNKRWAHIVKWITLSGTNWPIRSHGWLDDVTRKLSHVQRRCSRYRGGQK